MWMRILLFLGMAWNLLAGPVLLVVGTRPEAIKMAPVYLALQEMEIPTLLCSTGQHGQLLADALAQFGIAPDVDFDIMRSNQDLFHITQSVLERAKTFLLKVNPSLVLVHGDTATAFSFALASFYQGIRIGHVEAGVRSHYRDRPFPEEMNRRLISQLADYHFAPTEGAKENLLREGVDAARIFCTGNSVVDALKMMRNKETEVFEELRSFVQSEKQAGRKMILVTVHRREALAEGLAHIFLGLKNALKNYPEVSFIYPMHPNPQIASILMQSDLVSEHFRIFPPLIYKDLVWLLHEVDAVATDSGGIQEEAAVLGVPTVVLREETDRPEAIEAGIAFLVGMDEEKILQGVSKVLKSPRSLEQIGVYGDGTASRQIAGILKELLDQPKQRGGL